MEDLSLSAKLGLGASLLIFILLMTVSISHSGSHVPPNTVYVTETDYQINASRTSFHPGITYHFIVHNTSSDPHEFMIGPVMPNTSMSMEQMDAMSLAMLDDIGPGQTKSIDVTFPKAAMTKMSGMPATQSLEFSCHLPGHYESGMHLPLMILTN